METQTLYRLNIKGYTLLFLFGWTSLVVGLLAYNIYNEREQMLALAHAEARAALDKDFIYRLWNARLGGVYVPVTEQMQPNPYLNVPEREVMTTAGQTLTLINPAYMTRQVHELGQALYGGRGHITSMNPIRPENEPDQWEVSALKSFEQSTREVSEVVTEDGELFLRVMRPLIAEASCLKCHGQQGYQVGDVRGGLSVSVSMRPYDALFDDSVWSLSEGYGLLWFMGVGGILFTSHMLTRQVEEQKSSDLKLRESEKKFRALAENSSDYITRFGTDGHRLYDNPAAVVGADLWGTAEASEEMLQVMNVLVRGQASQRVVVRARDSGEKTYFDLRFFPERDEQGQVVSVLAIARDITEIKDAEQNLRVALHEKEVLLRELYHRTKNNMQVICSMISLQSSRVGDAHMEQVLQDLESKIRTMAMVHQKLYQSHNLSSINLQEYITELTSMLQSSYRSGLQFNLEVEPIEVLIDTAVPCGLVLNELIINACKYAFDGRAQGVISIRVYRQDGMIVMDVADDGRGFPAGLDWRKSNSLGLATVIGIVEHQLRGSITLNVENGVAWHITFRENLYAPRV